MMSAKKFFLLHCAPLLCMLKISFTFHFPFRSSSFEFFFFSFFSLKTKSLRMWRWMKLPMMMLVNQQTAHFQLCLSCTTAYSQSCVSFSHSLSTLCGVEFYFIFSPRKEGRFGRNFMLLTKKSVSHSLAAGIDFGRIIANEHSN